MNRRGFTLIELIATILIIAFIMSIVFPSITRVSKENDKRMYYEYENMMIEYAQVNVNNNNNNSIINLNDIDGLDKVKKDCEGYVTINRDITPPKYQAYIKCGNNYMTPGYSMSNN